MDILELKKFAGKIRKNIVELAEISGGYAHWGSSLSCADMLAALYGDFLSIDEKVNDFASEDKFLMSKGHAVAVFYSALYAKGLITRDDFESFQKDGSIFAENLMMDEKKHMEISSGSLALGPSMGVGLATLAKKKNYPYRTIVMVGDGECNEGAVWEAVMYAGEKKLNNLILIIDCNEFQCDNDVVINNEHMAKRVEAFGWRTTEIDGNDIEKCKKALDEYEEKKDERPYSIIMHTIKGKGVSFMEGTNEWHHKKLVGEMLEKAKAEVGAQYGY